MSGIDWSKAPEDAEIFIKGCPTKCEPCWVKYEGDFYWFSYDGLTNPITQGWKRWHRNIDSLLSMAVYRPSSPAWSGPQDGLPPVGVDLQWFSPVYGWIGGKVIAHDGQTIIVRHNDGYEGCYLHNVKACRTPEQIAAEEREAAIEEMRVAVGSRNNFPFAELYDAGYRKVEQPK
jgi:hypothetical protein